MTTFHTLRLLIALLLLVCRASANYDPAVGRWLSPDSMGHSASLSLYDYCDNDPLNVFDPDGRFSTSLWNKTVDAGKSTLGFLGSGMGAAYAAQSSASLTLSGQTQMAATTMQQSFNFTGHQQTYADAGIQSYNANYNLLGGHYGAINATFNPTYEVMAGASEAFNGVGLHPQNIGRDLSYQERMDSAAGSTFAGAQTLTLAVPLAKAGAGLFSATSANIGVPATANFAQTGFREVLPETEWVFERVGERMRG